MTGFSLLRGDGRGSPPPTKNSLIPSHLENSFPSVDSRHQIFIPSPPKVNFSPTKITFKKTSSCNHRSWTIFFLTSYSFDTQVMLILILIDVQYSQNAVFRFEKGSNRQNHSSSGSHYPVKQFPRQNLQFPLPFTAIRKTLRTEQNNDHKQIMHKIQFSSSFKCYISWITMNYHI